MDAPEAAEADAGILLVTGAAGGIGSEILRQARAQGLRGVAVSRRPLPAEAADLVIGADVSTAEGAATALAETVRRLGAPPGLLCHAAGAVRLGALERITAEDWQMQLRANLDSAFYILQAWARHCRRGPGAALLFSSVAAGMGTPSHAAVAAAKAGVEALVRSAASEWSARGLRVNALALALVDTPMTAGMLVSDRARQGVAQQYPLGRYGSAAEVAAQALWLLGPHSGWLTGQVLRLDGGFSAVRPVVRSAPAPG